MTVFHRGDVVRKLRDKQGWTQIQLAKKAGVNKGTVAAVEANDPTVGLDTWLRVCAPLGLTPEQAAQLANEDVTYAVTPPRHAAGAEEVPVSESPVKTRLRALIETFDDAEATIAFQRLRELIAEMVARSTAPPQKK